MISIKEAQGHILNAVVNQPVEIISVENALGRWTASEVRAGIDLPLFDVSAMDGYVFRWSDYASGMRCFPLKGEMKAGGSINHICPEKSAMSIYTGAAVPQGADSVVMVEKCIEKDGIVQLPEGLDAFQHIRKKGEQICKGEQAIPAKFKLNAAALSYMSALGITEVAVRKQPLISVLTTGDELTPPGKELKSGAIYESNGMALKSLFPQEVRHLHAPDTPDGLLKAIENALEQSDWLILTGGISAGKYDLVAEALSKVGVQKQFHKVNQKPGKPFYFGTKDHQLLFALPGNPAAVISCFYLYLYPAWQAAQGAKAIGMKKMLLPLNTAFFNKGKRAQLLKANTDFQSVDLLKGQGSHILHSFAQANSLVHLPAEEKQYQVGDRVLTYLLPHV